MKSFLRRIKNDYLKRITAFIVLEAMLMTYVMPLNANVDANAGNSANTNIVNAAAGVLKEKVFSVMETGTSENNIFPLILSYSTAKEKNLLILSWTKEDGNNNTKYYVYKKDGVLGQYTLVSPEKGLLHNFFMEDLSKNKNSTYIVSKYIDLAGETNFRSVDRIHNLSNEVKINSESKGSPLQPALTAYNSISTGNYLSWKAKQADIDHYLMYRKGEKGNSFVFLNGSEYEDRTLTENLKDVYYIWAFDKDGNASIPLKYSKSADNNGIYKIAKNADNTGKKTSISYKNINIEIPDNAAQAGSTITVTPVGFGNLKNLPENSSNVTMVEDGYAGYEVTLNGDSSNWFTKDIKVTLKYDETKIPESVSEDNIFVYYFNEASGAWDTLRRAKVDKENNQVVCSTKHFCEFYAGAMSIGSEPPQAKGINTEPVNIQKVDPMAGIFDISPPQPNNQGTANVSYPINVPEGINGMTPNLSINYSSDGEEGNCGYGWNIGVSSIRLDSRLKVPKYDGTDTLLLDGEEIIPVTTGSSTYRHKVEGSFSKIEKQSDGSFIVYETDGTKKYYGESSTSQLSNKSSITSGSGNILSSSSSSSSSGGGTGSASGTFGVSTEKIYAWFLKRVVNKWGNTITYDYNDVVDYSNRYLKNISYGYNNTYKIVFNWIDRTDVKTSVKAGFIIKNNKRLVNISIQNNAEIKNYVLNYVSGINGISTLDNITENMVNNGTATQINKHKFEYNESTLLNNFNAGYWIENFGGYGRDPGWGEDTNYYPELYKFHTGDFNGDGKSDIIKVVNHHNDLRAEVFLSTGSSFISVRYDDPNQGSQTYKLTSTVLFDDVNGDGKTDIMKLYDSGSAGYVDIYFSKGDGTFSKTTQFLGNGSYLEKRYHSADLNGDGKADIYRTYNDGRLYFGIFMSNGNGFNAQSVIYPDNNVYVTDETLYTGDFDGDGINEISYSDFKNSKVFGVLKFYSINNKLINKFSESISGSLFREYIGDLNGDKKDEILIYRGVDLEYDSEGIATKWRYTLDIYNGTDSCGFNIVNVFSTEYPNASNNYNYFLPAEEQQLTDINGDGKADYRFIYGGYEYNESTQTYNYLGYVLVKTAYNNGNGVDFNQYTINCIEPRISSYNPTFGQVLFADINGDGRPDTFYSGEYKTDNGFYYCNATVLLAQTEKPEILNKKTVLTKIANVTTNSWTKLGYSKVYTATGTATIPTNGYYNERCVLSSVTSGNDTLNVTTTVTYANGVYDFIEHDFRGFDTVTTDVYDSVKEVHQFSEATYYVGSDTILLTDTGAYTTDTVGNYTYSPYLKGQVKTIRKYRTEGTSTTPIEEGKTIYSYFTTGSDNVNLLDSNTAVKYTYCNEVRTFLYDDYGTKIGNDQTNGDVVSSVSVVLTNGLITSSTQINYGDPYITTDDTVTTVTNTNDTTNWLCLTSNVTNSKYLASSSTVGDKLGEKTITYNSDGSVQSESIWNNKDNTYLTTSYTYTANGEIATVTGADSLVTTFTYDYAKAGFYKETTVSYQNGLSEKVRVDCYGRPVEADDVYGDTTKVVYDDYNRVLSVIESDDYVNGVVTYQSKTFSYTKTTVAKTKSDGTAYNSYIFGVTANYKHRNDDESGDKYLTAQFFRDGLGREVQIKSKAVVGGVNKWVVSGDLEYDAMGRITEVYHNKAVDNSGYESSLHLSTDIKTTFGYDNLSRLKTTVKPSFGTESNLTITNTYSTSHDSTLGKIISSQTVIDTAGHSNTQYVDMMGVAVKSEVKTSETNAIVNTIDYDLGGYAKLTETPNTGETITGEKQYDSLGRLQWVKTPDAGKKEYFYNSLGQLVKIIDYGKDLTDTNSKEITLNYDSSSDWNRLLSIDYPGTDADITYEYYETGTTVSTYNRGNIKSITKGNGFTVEYEYGKYTLKETKTIDGNSYETNYEYDRQGRIKNLTYPDGEIVTYSYNDGGRLISIAGTKNNSTTTYISSILYDEYGQRTSQTYGNGVVQTYTYDEKTKLLSGFTSMKDSNGLLSYTYKFDEAKNVKNINSISNTLNPESNQDYRYDLAGRLIEGSGESYIGTSSTYVETYFYDNANRMTKKAGKNNTLTYNYFSGTHAISNITVAGDSNNRASIGFIYDDYGNLQTKTTSYNNGTSSVQEKYSCNAANELTKIDQGNGFVLRSDYDAGGQRIKKAYYYYNEDDEITVQSSTIYVNGFYTKNNVTGNVNKHISDGHNIIATENGDTGNTLLLHSEPYWKYRNAYRRFNRSKSTEISLHSIR